MTLTAPPTRPPAATPPGRSGPSTALRDRVPVVWLALALVLALLNPWFPGLGWAAIHLVLLGAITHSIMVWSAHFARALLKTRHSETDRRHQDLRILLHIPGTLLVVGGVTYAQWAATVIGAALVSAAVGWHGLCLWRQLRGALPGRFRITIHYYLAAALCLPVGATLGALLARGPGAEEHGRLLVAHSLTMVLGWVGLTVVGTLLTLWPTMLRTRLDDRAERLARQALPVLGLALVIIVGAALTGQRTVSIIGAAGYLLGVLWWGRALHRPARSAPPRHATTWSATAALVWFAVSLVLILVHLGRATTWSDLAADYRPITLAVTVGFLAQLLIGALSHLVPVVIGGGAQVWRTAQTVFDRYAVARITAANLGLVLWMAPTPPAVTRVAAALTLLALATFLPLLILATRAALKAKAARRDAPDRGTRVADPEKGVWSAGQFIAGLAAVGVALSLGIAADPAAAGLTGTASSPTSQARPTGETTTVTVEMAGMTFSPAVIEVPVGNGLVIEVVNTDPTTTHDLVLDTGIESGRLQPGQRATLDVGVVTSTIAGWCSVVGHRQMGMTMTVVAVDSGGDVQGGGDSGPAPGQHAAPAPGPSTRAQAEATVGAGFRAVDPALPALSASTVHAITLTAQEVELEVAPGIRQKRWTFNGTVPGPTLHGRVGDTFVITLVNDGSMGHSIDFHASSLAPDEPMRTIPPGESLTYRFTAMRAGIWMYHCSTMPMSAHIAAGMFGALVIEPPGLPEVAASYVIQQSGAYVLGDGRTDIQEVDAQAAMHDRPSFYSFNGTAFQYDHRPITVRTGERVRLWLLNAGPEGTMSFHVVGGQFDTTYREGGYLLKDGVDAFGTESGGSQALALAPGQGGFVELSLPEPGHYPFVSHDIPTAENGAHGILEAVP